jgi:hypothetical protein
LCEASARDRPAGRAPVHPVLRSHV